MPGANGTKSLVERYGERLVCVRYRYDEERRKRIKTVELVEEESSWVPSAPIYLVKIGYEEAELREKIKAAGGRWNAAKKAWLVSGLEMRRLGLEDRAIGWLESS